MNVGWVCPRCDAINSPLLPTCFCNSRRKELNGKLGGDGKPIYGRTVECRHCKKEIKSGSFCPECKADL